MLRTKIRRITTLVLAMAVAMGLVAHGISISDIGAKPAMISAASDMPMSADCNGCGGDQPAIAAGCAAFCGGIVGLPTTVVVLDMIPIDILRPSAGQHATGHVGPPDPYPPRPIGMS
jgi:hypothetical protein